MCKGAPTYSGEVFSKHTAIYDLYLKTSQEQADSDDNLGKWKNATKQDPENLLLKTYLGSSYTMVGRDSFFPWNKIKYTETGLDILEKAIDSIGAAENQIITTTKFKGKVALQMQMIAAITFLQVPNSIFKSKSFGMELMQKILQDPDLKTLVPAAISRIYLAYAQALEGKQQEEYAKKVISLNADKKDVANAKKLLND